MRAILNNLRMSPRKVRLVADAVRGKDARTAHATLAFFPKAAALPMQKLLQSAMKNAEQKGGAKENLHIAEIRVDAGPTLKRRMPRARGSAYPIRKRTSKITLVLDTKQANV